MSKNLSRRDFLKGSAASALGLAALGMAPAVEVKAEAAPEFIPQQAAAKLNPQDYDYRSKDTDMAAIFSGWKFGGLELSHRMVKSYIPLPRLGGYKYGQCLCTRYPQRFCGLQRTQCVQLSL